MKKRSTLRPVGLLLIALAAMAAATAYATGPLYVGGPGTGEGFPFVWNINPLTYWTDQGNLGSLGNTAANDLVQQAFQAWQSVPTSTLTFSPAGALSTDIQTGAQYLSLENDLNNCFVPLPPGSLAKGRSIIYDTDGSILQDLGEDPNSILGFATALCFTTTGANNNFNRGLALINGKSVTGPSSTTEVKAVMTHEFGHMIGLDHSQINLDCLTVGPGAPSCDLQGLPTMFPVLIDAVEMSTLATDDIAGISALYPTSNFASSTGRITGHVLFSYGQTPAQGFNVIARKTDNPLVIAVSNVSGFLFTADAGNPVYPWPGSDFGSRDPALIGFYDIPGLPPGDYTVGVEAIHNSEPIPFVLGSGLGPIGDLGFQFPLPSLLPTPPPCTPEYLVSGATATCSSAAAAVIPVAAGSAVSTGTDVILIGTPPRYDAWEDGP